MIPMKSKKRMMIPIDYLYDSPYDVGGNLLMHLFDQCTRWNSGHLFDSVYIPVKLVTSTGMAANYSYINVGLNATEMANLYWQKYSGMSLLGNYVGKSADYQFNAILYAFSAVFYENLGKYLKWIEVHGYEYNPLWNVDGTEIRQEIENSGINDIEYGGIDSNVGAQYRDTKTTRNTATFDGTTKKEWEDTSGGDGVAPAANSVEYVREITEGADKGKLEVVAPSLSGSPESVLYNTNGHKNSTKYIHQTAKNIVDGSEVDYAVAASDTAFGTALVGADRMHLEKYIRQGNIGVTKTTELIQAQRDLVRFSLIQEFFDDVNGPNLIGIYNL